VKEKTYGYIRVSSKDQNEDRQLLAMKEFGVGEKEIYADKQSGKDFERPAYQRVLRRLRPGDTLVIKSIDRLGATTKRSSSSGGASPEKNRRPSWCSICRCSIRGRGEI